ncbi:MAG: ABC transporter ATP-binding protein [Verrucomicrobiota bacterium]
MNEPTESAKEHSHSSRRRYQGFVQDYKRRALDDTEDSDEQKIRNDAATAGGQKKSPEAKRERKAKRREYLREYLRWLKPHRYAVGALFAFALVAAGLEMVEPLFMRFIVDHVLLSTKLDTASRLSQLHVAGALFVGLVVLSRLVNVLKDYRQRLVNVRVMLSLRRSLFDRLLHLPLPKIWDMKTGGILSRLTGDVDTTTGLLQMAIMSPAISVIRLIIAVVLLLTLNWRLALTALAIIPGVMLMSFTFSKRIRPIYRTI